MRNHRFARIATLALAVSAMAAPTAAAYTQPPQDLRSPDTRDAARAAQPAQDLRSPDTRDAARAAEADPTVAVSGQDLRSPDARDAAGGRGTFNAPDVRVVTVSEPSSSGGLDWGDAGIGAGGLLGLILLGLGSTLLVVHRRQARQPATG